MILIQMPGLKLYGKNVILRWGTVTRYSKNGKPYQYSKRRADETKRLRNWVTFFGERLWQREPLTRARVKFFIAGPYKHDHHSIWIEDALDAIVARMERKPVPHRRWGVIVDDSPAVIGMPEVEIIKASAYAVGIQIEEVKAKKAQ